MELTGESYFYHHTFTFHLVTWDYAKAKKTLNFLLDNLHQRFNDMACIYTTGRQGNGGLHFHAGFYFFPDSELPFFPSRMECDFRAAVFSAWNRLQGGSLVHEANKMTNRKDTSYFLKNLREVQGCRRYKGRRVRWWGYRNSKLIRQHSVPVSELAVDEECAKRRSPVRRDVEKAETSVSNSVFPSKPCDEAAMKLEAASTPLCVPVSEEWPSFDWADSDADCKWIDEMALF